MVASRVARILRTLWTIPSIVTICLVSISARAQTSRYVFLSDQSTLVQTGGIAGVHEIYPIEGQFQLTMDAKAGVASFEQVEAFLLSPVSSSPPQELGELFNMTSLAGAIVDGGASVRFKGSAPDTSSVLITLTFTDNTVSLKGQTTPPPNSADFFIFTLDAVAQRKYSGGTGKPDDPYQIATAEDLIALGETPEDYDKHFILTADIDMDASLPGRKVFEKALIGSDQEFPFTGVFNGDGHTISHLVISGDPYLGVFGRLEASATVRRLGLVDVEIDGSGFFGFGGLVGCNRGIVIGCHGSGMITGGDFVGGLVGENSGAVLNCHSTCSVTGGYLVGGLAGDNDGAVFNCYGDCSVSGSHYVGGLVGRNVGNMINCYSTGAADGNEAIGGLVGVNGYCLGAMAHPGYIDRSYSLAGVRGEFLVGGLVGDNFAGDVTQCYSKGEVEGGTYVGGLTGGNNGRINRSYSTGAVSGEPNVGGLVGGGWLPDTTASFWDTQTSGQSTSFGGIGKTTVEMQMADTFVEAGWDFSDETANGTADIWSILEGEGYPRLYWEFIEGIPSETPSVLEKASDPYPADGAIGVEERWSTRLFELAWIAGPGAVAHNVYLGTDLDTVSQSNVDTVPGALIIQNLRVPELRLWTLERDKTYYWRIDEIGSDGTIVTGDVWSFTTALQPSWWKGRACFTSDTPVWIDGNPTPISNAVVGHVVRCGAGQNEVGELQVHEGVFTCYDIVLETGNCITVAECHYFMSESGHWIAVHNLNAGTRLKTSKGNVAVASLRKRTKPYTGKVFNLRVKGSDRYLVGADAVVVRDY